MSDCPRSPYGDCRPAAMVLAIAHLRARLADMTEKLGNAEAHLSAAQHERNTFRESLMDARAERDALRDRAERVERERDVALGEVARLRAVIAEAADGLRNRPGGAFLSPARAEAVAVRQALIAALGGDR